MTWFNVCCLDARHFPTLPDIINKIKQVKASASNEAVLFLLSFPVQHVELWRRVLVRTFSRREGYANVIQYHLDCVDVDISIGQAAICIGEMKAKAMLSHVQFVRSPPAHGCAKFGESMIYVEIQFRRPNSAIAHTIGILWAPDLFCVGKSLFNDSNYWGAMTYMSVTLACERYVSLSTRTEPEPLSTREPEPEPVNEAPYPSVREAMHSLRAHLAGVLVITDMRSNYFGDGLPLHKWHMSGKMHAVQGTFANGEFRDTCAHEKIACSPACYRIRDRARPYHVMNHSFGFWSEEFYTDEVPAGFVLQTCPQETCPESVSVSSCAVATSTLGTENKERLVGTIAWCAWRMETTSECMVCLSRPPTFVLKVCGHCGLCGHCWKWMCKEQFNKNRSERCQVSPAALKTKQVANVAIQCPYCRQVTQAVHHSRYTGTMYSV